MRPPRPGLPWSRSRVARRVCYSAWMAGPEWLATRERWLQAWLAIYGRDPTCQICGSAWTLKRGHLHHRRYDRIGHERFADLIPLDRACHDRLHRILESSPAWSCRTPPRVVDGYGNGSCKL